MSKEPEYIKKYVNGEGPPYYYGSIISSIREVVCKEIEDKGETSQGAIIFYQYDDDQHELCMNVFPLAKDNINGIPEKHQEDVLKIINSTRPYKDLYHLDHFNEFFKTEDHFCLNPRDHSKAKIKVQVIKSVSTDCVHLLIDEKERIYSWNQLIELFTTDKENDLNKNTLDQFFFPFGQEEFIFIPLPILSNPCILVVLPNTMRLSVDLAKEVIPKLQAYIYNYMILRLIDRLDKEVLGKIETEKCFVEKFTEEIAHVLLPIQYRICEDKIIKWVQQWPDEKVPKSLKKKEHRHFVTEFRCEKGNQDDTCYRVVFELTNFYFDHSDHSNKWITQTEFFQREQAQLKMKLQSIFKLVYHNWDYLKNFKERLVSELNNAWPQYWKNKLKGIKLNVSDVSELFQGVSKIGKVIEEAENWKPGEDLVSRAEHQAGADYTHWKEGDRTIIKFNGIRIYDGTDKGAQDVTYMIDNEGVDIDINDLPSKKPMFVKPTLTGEETCDFQTETASQKGRNRDTEREVKKFVSETSLKADKAGGLEKCELLVGILMELNILPFHNSYKKITYAKYKSHLYTHMDNIEALQKNPSMFEHHLFKDMNEFNQYKIDVEKRIKHQDAEISVFSDRSKTKNNIKSVINKICFDHEGPIEIYFKKCFITNIPNKVKYMHDDELIQNVNWE